MGGNSFRNSGSFAKGILKKVMGAPRASVSNATSRTETPTSEAACGIREAPVTNVACPGVSRLNREGFLIYNLPEENEIFVSGSDESSFFDEGEPMASPGVEVDESVSQIIEEEVCFKQAADMFSNAMRRKEVGEVDFDEVIVKSYSTPAPLMVIEGELKIQDNAVSDIPISKPMFAMTGSVGVEESRADVIVFKDEEVSEIVEGSSDAGVPMDVKGIRVEGTSNISPVESEEVSEDMSSYSVPLSVEPVATSKVMEEPMVSVIPESDEPVVEEVQIDSLDESVPTVEVHEVKDVVGDILKMTLPELVDAELMMSDLPEDRESYIPDDGLESYDARFDIRVSESSKPAGSSFHGVSTIGSSLGFTF